MMIYAGLDGIKKKIEFEPIEKNIYQSVFEFGNDYKVLCSHTTFDEANKDVLDFVSFCDKC